MKGEKARTEQQTMLKRTDALVKFKARLIADINATPYPQQVRRRGGSIVAGTASRANDAGIEMRTQYGNSGLQWAECSLETMWSMGRFYMQAEQVAAEKSERQWTLGIFGVFAGKKAEGKTMLTTAAEAKAEYKTYLPLFLEGSDAP